MKRIPDARSRRFPAKLPVDVQLEDGSVHKEVQSRDVSGRSIYLELAAPVDVGSRLELLVKLPEQVTKGEPVQVRCFGKVARVERRFGGDDQVGIGATIERFVFVDESSVDKIPQ